LTDSLFSSKILFSDEAHFIMDGFVNKQNCRIWSDENPRVIQERSLHPKKSYFSVHFGQMESLGHISSKMMLEMLLLWMVNGTKQCWVTFYGHNWVILMCLMSISSKTVLHVTQLEIILRFCDRNFPNV